MANKEVLDGRVSAQKANLGLTSEQELCPLGHFIAGAPSNSCGSGALYVALWAMDVARWPPENRVSGQCRCNVSCPRTCPKTRRIHTFVLSCNSSILAQRAEEVLEGDCSAQRRIIMLKG